MKIQYGLIAMLTLVAAISVPATFAQESTILSLKTIGDSVIDLNSPEQDRFITGFALIENFDLNDGYFWTKVVHSSGTVIAEYEVKVGSTATGLVDFGSMVAHVVTDESITEDNVNTGEYELLITTKDGSVTSSIPFSIIDTRS